MSSAFSVSASPGFQVSPRPKSSPFVTTVAIQTETVHPTWIVTLPNTEAALITELHDILSTRNLEASTTESIRLSTADTALPTTSPTSILETLATSSPTENSPSPTIVGTSYSDVSSSMDVTPIPSTSTSTSQPSPSVVEETAYTRFSTSPTTVTTPSPSRPSTSPFIGIVTHASISGGSTPTSSSSGSDSDSTLSTSSKAGIIAGSTLGGCAIIALLFAIIFCIRRKRSLGHLTRQHLHTSINPPSQSSPTLPLSMSQPSTIPIIRTGRHAYYNPDSSLDSMYLRHERVPNVSQDSIHPPSSAEILPSRIASFYSTSTWDGGYGLEEYWDLERGNLTKHNSMRSNPFDLEPPSNVHPAGTALG